MKRIFLSTFILCLTLTFLQSCNEDVDLIGEFTETAVVYGVIDQADSVHFVKINRAFIGPGNSLEIAQIPDSSYFKSVSATITEIGGEGRTWILKDTTVTNKDENGVFYAPEQKLYTFYSNSIDNSNSATGSALNPSATYRFKAIINGGEFEVSGETKLVSGITEAATNPINHFKFAQNPGEYKSSSISASVGNSYVINGSITTTYNEFVGLTSTPKSFKWNLGEYEVSPNSTRTFSVNGETFYQLIANSCETSDASIDKRTMESMTVEIVGGAEEFYNYILVNKPSSSIAQNKPTYTNLTATNGHPVIGIFSSRFTYRETYVFKHPTIQLYRCLDPKSTEELCIGPITGLYLFCSNHDGDLGQSWHCN
jgi:hypothetical protein